MYDKMDIRIDRFLNEHNLTQYRDTFLNFDFATFINLNVSIIATLISCPCDRIKLHKALMSFINGSDTDAIEILPDQDVYEIDIGSIENGTELPEFIEFIPAANKRKPEELLQPELPSLTITKMPRIEKAETIDRVIKPEPEDIETIEMLSDSEDDNENHNVVDTELTIFDGANSQQQAKNNPENIINKMNLKEIPDLDMYILFAVYTINKGFSDTERALLSEVIIKELLLQNSEFRIGKTAFLKLAELIVETFPREQLDSYFVNSTFFDGMGINERGSLYTAYKKYQSIMSSAGMPIAKELCPSGALKFSAKLEYEYIESRSERFKMIEEQHSRSKFSTIKYMEMYPVLQLEKGYELIMRDAESIYPNLKGFVNNFGKFARNVIQYAKRQQIHDEYVSNLLSYTNRDLSETNVKLLAILLLPYILPETSIRQSGKVTKITRFESSVHFVRLYKNAQEEVDIYGKLFKINPRFITDISMVNLKLYGELDNITEMVVKNGMIDYEFKDPLQAIEAYFKLLLGMHLPYPYLAELVFYFFGKIAFNTERKNEVIKTLYDINGCVNLFYQIINKS